MAIYELDHHDIRDISSEVLGWDGRLKVLSADYWLTTTAEERALFGHRYGYYGFPTVELVEHLKELIGDRKAIEIGSGNGVLAEALGIPATDNRSQEKEPWRTAILLAGQPTVPYGDNVEDCHASRAVRQYKPDVVIGCWVTHKWDPARPEAGGFEAGVDEEDILRNCAQYVLIGNERVHKDKKIWPRLHTIDFPTFVYSRAMKPRDFICTWRGLKR